MTRQSLDVTSAVQEFHRDGFAIVRSVYSPNEVRLIVAQLQCYLEHEIDASVPGEVYFDEEPTKAVRCVFRMHERSGYFRRLMAESRLVGLIESIYDGAEVIQDGVMLIDKPPHASYEFPWHQDNAYQFWNPPEAVAATLALDESILESGTIVCLRGSHVLPVLSHQPSGVLGASLGLAQAPDIARYPETALSLRPGDLALHHVNTIHRTGPNQTASHRRNLGFSYHSCRTKRDDEAHARFQRHIKRVNALSSRERD